MSKCCSPCMADLPDSTSDAICLCRAIKLLSEDPGNYSDAPREGIRRILEEVTGSKHPREEPLDTSQIESIRMGTTVSLGPCGDVQKCLHIAARDLHLPVPLTVQIESLARS